MQAFRTHLWLLGGLALVPVLAALPSLSLSGWSWPQDPATNVAVDRPVRTIGPIAQITEASTGLEFVARVDTGAAVTSLHCLPTDCQIEDASDDPWQNLGKPVRLRVENRRGVEAWINSQIEDYVEVRSANGAEHRYRIRLPLRFGEVLKETIVNLNDRSEMSFRMLLGRDFLAGDFVVDVAMDGTPSS